MINTILIPFKRLILRAVLNDVSPIVARVCSIPDDVEITELHARRTAGLRRREGVRRDGKLQLPVGQLQLVAQS
jgi:hypothetical protein